MSIHKPHDRHFAVLGGNVMTSGGSVNLAKGQFGIFSLSNPTIDGLKAVSSFSGVGSNAEFQLKLGAAELPYGRSQNNKASASVPFKISDVVGLSVGAPKNTENVVDEVLVGYDGINADTAITFLKGSRKAIYIRLSGEWVGMLGYPDNFVTIEYVMGGTDPCPAGQDCSADCDNCDAIECVPVIEDAIEFLKNYELIGGVKVSEAVDITPVKSCDTVPTYATSGSYSFYSLDVTDAGDLEALALVQAQFPDYKVVRTNYVGTTSTYQIVAAAGLTLADYAQSIAGILKGCDDCPAGYTATDGGILYAVSIVDGGADLTTTVDDLAGFVTGSVIKQGQNGSIGFYTLLTDDEVTDAEITTFLGDSDTKATATITKVGTVSEFCNNATTTDYTWVEGDSCTVSQERYEIALPDTVCGESRLAELQAAYPNMTIVLKGTSKKTVTLSGTSGTANVAIAGTNYLATFNASLTQTAADFVTTHAATLLALGYTVTAAAGVITVTADTLTFPTVTITNASGDLAGTVSALTEVTTVTGGCQTYYAGLVETNIVCDECADVFKDYYRTATPSAFETIEWTKIAATPAYDGCLCGIRLKGKETIVFADEYLRDSIGFIDTSTKIEVSGGYITEIREGIGAIIDQPFAVKYLSRWQPRTHMGGNLWTEEERSRFFFTGESRHENYLERLLSGDTSNIEAGKQYIDYALTIKNNRFSNSMSNIETSVTTYHMLVEVGRHAAIETLLNKLAAAAGLPSVQA